MKLWIPKTISSLVANSIPENEYPVWAAGTTFALNAYCIKTSTHRVYQSLSASNVGNDPELTLGTKWADVGPTNAFAMFDSKVSTASTAYQSISVELDCSKCDALSLFNMVAVTSVRVQQKYAGAVISDQAFDLTVKDSTCWTDYLFKTPTFKTQLYLPLMLNYNATVVVTLSGAGNISCGGLYVGLEKFLGLSRFGLQIGIIDFSKKGTDAFGNTYLAQGAYAKKAVGDLYLLKTQVDNVFNIIAATRGTPTVWFHYNVDTGPMDSLIFLGFFKDYQITLQDSTHATCSFEVEGLI